MSREVHVRFWERVRVKSPRATRLPLYRQSQIYAREGVDLDRSTMADWVGKSTGLLEPLAEAIAKRAKGGTSLFADDTPLKMLAPGNKKDQGQPASGPMSETNDHGPARAPQAHKQTICPAVLDGHRPAFGISSQWIERVSTRSSTCLVIKAGCMRMAMPVSTACSVKVKPRKWPAWPTSDASLSMCLPHKGSAIAGEAIKRIAQLYGVEKQARGQSPEARAALRQENAKPIFDDLEEWLRDQLPKISGKSPLAKAIRYALGRMPKTRPYLDNGFLELDNNTAERAMKPVAIGRKNWMFAGSQRGGNSMAIAFTLIETAKLNGVDPQAWLT